MPNWCSNTLEITTKTPHQFTKLIQGITGNQEQPFDFNRVIPIPEELRNTTSPNNETSQEMITKYGFADWYDFCCTKWGTKWNASESDVNIESPTSVIIRFQTAWSPPLPIVETIATKYPFARVVLDYECEEGTWGQVTFEKGQLTSDTGGDIDCEYRIRNWGECYDECEYCGVCDCDCGCEQPTPQTVCSDCNENDHQNNNNLPEYTNKEERKEINA